MIIFLLNKNNVEISMLFLFDKFINIKRMLIALFRAFIFIY